MSAFQAIIKAPIDGASKVFTNQLELELAAVSLYENFREHCPKRNWAAWCEEFYGLLLAAPEDFEEDEGETE
jgi:hypothetical protein